MAECLEMDTPVCAVEPIPGQEMKNANFIESNGFGIYPKSVGEFRDSIEMVLNDRCALQEMKFNLKKYRYKQGAREIKKMLLKMS